MSLRKSAMSGSYKIAVGAVEKLYGTVSGAVRECSRSDNGWISFVVFRRLLRCPDSGEAAEVGVELGHAGFPSALDRPELRVKACALWLKQRSCSRRCTGFYFKHDTDNQVTEVN